MNPSLLFFLAGLLGSALRACATTSQATLSVRSGVDIVVGGLVGMLLPVYPLIPFHGDLWQQGAIVALASYASASLLQGVLGRIPSFTTFLGPGPGGSTP